MTDPNLAALKAAARGVRETVITIDARCMCQKCEKRSKDIYRMIGSCSNCGSKNLLILFRAGDRACSQDCPVCRCWGTVGPYRLATADEIPEAP